MINWLKKIAMNHFPKGIVDYMFLQKRNMRRIRYNLKQKLNPVSIDLNDLVDVLKKIGLESGDKLFMHSSMSNLGYIKGGPDSVIKALEKVVGEEGLITMPAFPLIGTSISYLKRGETFDVKNTPSRMGAITEAFRKAPHVERSFHPTHSVCAKGLNAKEFVEGHENSSTPFGMDSPFGKMIEQNVLIIGFGAEIHHFTLQNTFADSCGEKYPFKIYSEKKFTVQCIDTSGRGTTVETLVNDPVLSEKRWDSTTKRGVEIKNLLEKGGLLHVLKFGNGEILTIRAKDFFAELGCLLEQGITVYDMPVKIEKE